MMSNSSLKITSRLSAGTVDNFGDALAALPLHKRFKGMTLYKVAGLGFLAIFGLESRSYAGGIAYIRESDPWGDTVTDTAMTSLYGANAFDIKTFTDVGSNFNTVLGGYNTVVLQGSDSSGTAFLSFLDNNRTSLESWVSNGGRAFMYFGANGVPSGNYNLGFGLTAVYPSYADYGFVSEPLLTTTPGAAPTLMNGNYFGHSTVTTSGASANFTTLIEGYTDQAMTNYVGKVLVGGQVGNGFVVAGGITLPNFWSTITGSGTPNQTLVNVLNYAGTSGGTTDLNGTPVGGSSSEIDGDAESYSASDLGNSVTPVFDGGVLALDVTTVTSDLAVKGTGGTLEAQSGTETVISGVISDSDASNPGGLTVTQTGSGGSITLSAANTYTGATQIEAGATLNLTGSLSSTSLTVASGAQVNNVSGGFSADATLTNGGTVTFGADEAISTLTNAGTLEGANKTLTASVYELNSGSVVNVNLGRGALLSNGSVELNGTAEAETTDVQSGTLTLRGTIGGQITVRADALVNNESGGFGADTVLDNSGSINLGANDTVASVVNSGAIFGGRTLTADTVELNEGSEINVSLVTSSLTTSGTVLVNRAVTSDQIHITSGAATFSGQFGGSVGVDAGAQLIVRDRPLAMLAPGAGDPTLGAALVSGGFLSTTALDNSGTVSFGSNQTIASLVNSGTLNGEGVTLTAATYALNNGALVKTNLGAGTLTSNGTVEIQGSTAAEVVNVQTGLLKISGAGITSPAVHVDVGGASKLLLDLSSALVAKLTGSGTVEQTGGTGSSLTLHEGDFSGSLVSTGTLVKESTGTLALSGASTFSGSTVRSGLLDLKSTASLTGPVHVTGGSFKANGSVSGLVTVESGATLSGSGLLRNGVVNRGVVSPGNSPGILTVTGDYSESGTLLMEIDGASGAGVAGGFDQLNVSGRVLLNAGSTLKLGRSVAGSFELSSGQRLRLVNATGGIDGQFTNFDRSAFGTTVLFDLDTGDVVGTGVAQGGDLLSLVGNAGNQRQLLQVTMANSVLNDSTGQASYLRSKTADGALFNVILQSGSVANALDALSPETYASLTDYGLNATRHYSRKATTTPVLVGEKGWSLSAGYTDYLAGTDWKDGVRDYNLRSRGATVGLSKKVKDNWSVRGFVAVDQGTIRAPRLSYDADGQAVGVSISRSGLLRERLQVNAGYTYGAYDMKGTRRSVVSTLGGRTKTHVDDVWAGASVVAFRKGPATVSAFGELSYTRATVNGFSEGNQADAFVLNRMGEDNVIGELGAELAVDVTSGLSVTGSTSYVKNFINSRREVYGRLGGASTGLRVTHPGLDEEAVRFALSADHRLGKSASVGAAYSVDLSKKADLSESLSVRVQVRF